MNSSARVFVAWLGLSVLGAVCAGNSRPWLFVSLMEERQIVSFERDRASGRLQRRAATACPEQPACLAISPDKNILYVSYRSSGQIASYRIDAASGQLTAVSAVSGGEDPAFLLTDSSGRFLLSAYYVANKVNVNRLEPDGTISGQPLQSVATAEKAHGIAFDSKNRFAFVPHTGANRIYQFRFDSRTGRLTANEPAFVSTPSASHPRHIVLHPSDRWAYVGNEADGSLSVFGLDSHQGTLRHLQTASTLPDGYDRSGNATARCEMTPDGRFVYVANRGHDSIAGFAIDSNSGRITPLGQVETEKTPRSFTIDPSGRFLYAAGQASGRLAAYRIEDDGTLKRIGTFDSGPVSWWTIAVDVPMNPD